jgi:predicted nucleic acid-binding Zn ribbon protein
MINIIGILIGSAVTVSIAMIGWYRSDKREREKKKAKKDNQSIGVFPAGCWD